MVQVVIILLIIVPVAGFGGVIAVLALLFFFMSSVRNIILFATPFGQLGVVVLADIAHCQSLPKLAAALKKALEFWY